MIWNPRIEHSADLHHLASLSSVEFALSFFPPPKPSRPRARPLNEGRGKLKWKKCSLYKRDRARNKKLLLLLRW